jgi:wobble nucleotide-excising tRNase
MLSKIDISKFGLFNEYEWDKSISKEETFRRLNIIYGRNYSGKTTLARILKCLEDQKLHKDYPDCDFSLTLDDKSKISHNNLSSFTDKVRVYNTDFVRENLSWLHNEDGSIAPFTILGAKNVELEKRITEINELLGSEEAAKGLLHECAEERSKVEEKRQSCTAKNNAIEEKLRIRANDKIKLDSTLFLGTTVKKSYAINDIKTDIDLIKANIDSHILATEKVTELAKTLTESNLPDISPLKEGKPGFAEFVASTTELLGKRIKPSKTITDLLNDNLLQEWVRQGIDKHKDIRETCGFCGHPLDKDLWDKLGAHFSKESEELRTRITSKIEQLNQAKRNLSTFPLPNKNAFYLSLQENYDQLYEEWTSAVGQYISRIDLLITPLETRLANIFQDTGLPTLNDFSSTIFELIQKFNALLTQHNLKSSTLVKDQLQNRKLLRFSHIAQFLKDIDYLKLMGELKKSEEERTEMEKSILPKIARIETLNEEKRKLEAEAKDESKGAELVNEHLSHFFGHDELKLVAEGQTPLMRFSIQRDNKQATNLSEGECSLISFCYFIAKMEDELKDPANSNKLIIYVDDPISSLDCNHIFFMFSLIENVIAKPGKYGQLFISTHNLDFLKYLKQLTIPKYKPQPDSKPQSDIKHFMIERKGKGVSILKNSPAYLRDYITEFNYLFHQIYKCSEVGEDIIVSDHQYNFGNNLRKFLEAYTFYKYPSHNMSFKQRLEKFFDDDQVSRVLIFRMVNEYSHLEEQFDRSIVPIDVTEISKISKAVIEKIKLTDIHQYNALVESIN